MIELTSDECKAMRDIASGRAPHIDSEVIEQLKARKLVNITLGGRIIILEAGERWYDSNCEQ